MGKKKTHERGNVNEVLCDMLYELADYEKSISGNTYKYSAYRRAAQVLALHPVRIKSGEEAKRLPGIGKSIADKIDEFLATGKVPKLEEIKKDAKFRAIQNLTRVSGIGPAKARHLVNRGVFTISDLEKIKDELTHHQRIGLKYLRDFELKVPRSEVAEIEQVLIQKFKEMDDKYKVTICGSYRRGKATSGDVDCLITHPDYNSERYERVRPKSEFSLQKSIKKLIDAGLVIDTIALGPSKFMGVFRLRSSKPARRLDIRLSFHDQYYCGVLYFTGSDLFNQKIRLHAREQGLFLNEYYIRPIKKSGTLGDPLPVTCEKDIFDYISYPYKSPEERNL